MKLLIYGAGGLALDIIDTAQRINQAKNCWDEIVLLDDYHPDRIYYDYRVIDFNTALQYKDESEMVIGLGEPAYRERLYNKCTDAGFQMVPLIDPSAIVSETVDIGPGTIVLAYGYIVGNAKIGNNVLTMPRVIIGHDTVVGDHSVIGDIVSMGGGTVIGHRTYIANGSAISDNVSVGDDAIVGMGTTVFSDVPQEMIVLGNPGRVVRKNEKHRVFGN